MVMVHGDDKGLVLPPKVSSVQVIVVPVPFKDANTQGIFDACAATVDALCEAGIRAEADYRENYSPGWKYSHWEMKGVPLRIEIGPKDLANNQASIPALHFTVLVSLSSNCTALSYIVSPNLFCLLLESNANSNLLSAHRYVLFAVTMQQKWISVVTIWRRK
jgi:hypothetical protein